MINSFSSFIRKRFHVLVMPHDLAMQYYILKVPNIKYRVSPWAKLASSLLFLDDTLSARHSSLGVNHFSKHKIDGHRLFLTITRKHISYTAKLFYYPRLLIDESY